MLRVRDLGVGLVRVLLDVAEETLEVIGDVGKAWHVHSDSVRRVSCAFRGSDAGTLRFRAHRSDSARVQTRGPPSTGRAPPTDSIVGAGLTCSKHVHDRLPLCLADCPGSRYSLAPPCCTHWRHPRELLHTMTCSRVRTRRTNGSQHKTTPSAAPPISTVPRTQTKSRSPAAHSTVAHCRDNRAAALTPGCGLCGSRRKSGQDSCATRSGEDVAPPRACDSDRCHRCRCGRMAAARHAPQGVASARPTLLQPDTPQSSNAGERLRVNAATAPWWLE